MDKVILKNAGNGTLCLSYPNQNIKFRAVLLPNREVSISREDYEDILYDAGTLELIQNGALLVIEGEKKTRTLEEAIVEDKKDADGIVLSREEVINLLQNGTIAQFTTAIRTASSATRESIGQVAVELAIADGAHTELIKKYCGIDVIKALNLKPTE